MPDQAVTFGRFRLDPHAGLTHGKRQVKLTPKALALLCFLADQHGRVVTKEQLFDAIWPRAEVGDAALVSCVQELRRALRDDARRPRYIETLHRRGYRFIAPASVGERAQDPDFAATGALPEYGLVGREAELTQLDEALAGARAGKRQVVLIGGEAGIGKTTLVRGFLSRAARSARLQFAWGQSVEHYGATEPYHPLLDALTRLCRAPQGEEFLRRLEVHAPLWLAQMPTLVSPARLRALQRRVAGATRERMQRELTHVLEAAAASSPLMLWLEDLHWADVSTIDWLAAFARRPEPARVLVVATYRPAQARAEHHPLHAMRDELRRQGQSRMLALGPLSSREVEQYVTARFTPRAEAAPALSRLAGEVYSRTEGSPLFMVGVLNELVARGLLACADGAWTVHGETRVADLGIPEYLRQAIEWQLERVDPKAARLLEVASVAGQQFSVATLAACLGASVSAVEMACKDSARRHLLLQAAGTEEWPDGTIASRFGFVHALYREALLEGLPEGRRIELHRRIGERLVEGFREQADEIAAQLAMHFERGRDARRAVLYFRKAAEVALRRHASREAAAHLEHARELLRTLPAGRSRDEIEAAIQIALCEPLFATHGLGSPLVEACAMEAQALCTKLGDSRGGFLAHRVVWNHSLMRHPVPASLVHARELMAQAKALKRPVELALAHRALGCTLVYAGEHREAERLLARGAAHADAVADAQFAGYGEHPGMICRAFGGWAKALMGLQDDALELASSGIEHARRRDEPHGLAFALVTAGLMYLFQRDVRRAELVAREALSLSQEYQLPQWTAFAHEIRGWVACQRGERGSGIALMTDALQRLHATGARTHTARMRANLAESCLADGQLQMARVHIDAALAHRASHGEHYYAAELYRLHAVTLHREGAPRETIQAALQEAMAIARMQGARLLLARAQAAALELLSSLPCAGGWRRTRESGTGAGTPPARRR